MNSMKMKASLLFIVCYLCSSNNGGASSSSVPDDSHTVSVRSLLPPSFCNRTANFPQGSSKLATFEVVSKYSPCYYDLMTNQAKTTDINDRNIPYPSLGEILRQDNLRVRSKAKLKNLRIEDITTSGGGGEGGGHTFPTVGQPPSASQYVARVALGEPKQYVSVELDTGSHLTWTQCAPCGGKCFQQKDSLYTPSKSKSFSKIPCNSQPCQMVADVADRCNSKKECRVELLYGDGSNYTGYYGYEKLSIQETESGHVFTKYPYVFGCINSGGADLNGDSGLMGLDRNPVSVIYQTNTSYFSYCFPSLQYGSTGYITFGKPDYDEVKHKLVRFTPVVTSPQKSEFYDITLTGISVAGKMLAIEPSAFTTMDSSVIDSGTVITRFPPSMYAALRTAFRKRMTKYKAVEGQESIDTCYDLSGYENVVIPKVSLHLLGGVDLDLDVRGIVLAVSEELVCLGFSIAPDGNSFLLGNVQQRGFQIDYDVAGRRVGFGPGGCS